MEKEFIACYNNLYIEFLDMKTNEDSKSIIDIKLLMDSVKEFQNRMETYQPSNCERINIKTIESKTSILWKNVTDLYTKCMTIFMEAMFIVYQKDFVEMQETGYSLDEILNFQTKVHSVH